MQQKEEKIMKKKRTPPGNFQRSRLKTPATAHIINIVGKWVFGRIINILIRLDSKMTYFQFQIDQTSQSVIDLPKENLLFRQRRNPVIPIPFRSCRMSFANFWNFCYIFYLTLIAASGNINMIWIWALCLCCQDREITTQSNRLSNSRLAQNTSKKGGFSYEEQAWVLQGTPFRQVWS